MATSKKPFPFQKPADKGSAKPPSAKAKPGMAAMSAMANRPKAKKKG